MRGKPGGEVDDAGGRGLIPAYAGKTLSLDTHHYTRGAHPRVCGENDTPAGISREINGSSPRMRGKRRKR